MIEISNLSKTYNETPLFNIPSLKIESGKVTCIYGKSGSGKTSLLNIIGMLDSFQAGTIEIDGVQIYKPLSKKAIACYEKKFSYITQKPFLISYETVIENLSISNVDEGEIDYMLAKFDLLNKKNSLVSSLSGGEQQRISILLAILKNSDIVLADEPTGNLDVVNRDFIFSIFKEIASKGKTVIIVSHDQYIIENCDIRINLEQYK